MAKVAFVASGGGMMCAYAAGVISALQDSGIRPDIFIGSSGSAGTVSYFACGQANIAAKLWREEVTNPRVLRKQPLKLDVDYIIDSMRDRFPFNETALRDTNMELYLATTDRRSLRTRFFSNHENLSWYEVMRASMAIPFVYGKKVSLDGGLYFDGDISTTLNASIALAQRLGATDIYVCNTGFASYWQSAKQIGLSPLISLDFLRALYCLIRNAVFPVKTQAACIMYFTPAAPLAVSSLDNSRASVDDAIQKGYDETFSKLQKALNHSS